MSPDRRRTDRWPAIGLLLFSGALYPGLAGTPALVDDDIDAAHALVAREMLERGDFVVPYQNGIRYLIPRRSISGSSRAAMRS